MKFILASALALSLLPLAASRAQGAEFAYDAKAPVVACRDSRRAQGDKDLKVSLLADQQGGGSQSKKSFALAGNISYESDLLVLHFARRAVDPKKPGSYNVEFKAIQGSGSGEMKTVGRGYFQPQANYGIVSVGMPWLKCKVTTFSEEIAHHARPHLPEDEVDKRIGKNSSPAHLKSLIAGPELARPMNAKERKEINEELGIK